MLTGLGTLALAAWIYLILFHGRFWTCSERLRGAAELKRWPEVAAVVPARNEEDAIAAVLTSLTAQDYPGALTATLVDDRSTDRTRAAAGSVQARGWRVPLTIVTGEPLPRGWAGKLWALKQGIDAAIEAQPETEFLFLSDADIGHDADTLRRLVAKAQGEDRDLVSLMARLNCTSGWERLLIPAFIFFFQKLYPFPRVNRLQSRTAAAAGGCVLIRRSALERIGGIAAIRGALIDDCTLAAAVKRSGGRIWLGLADGTRSLRVYGELEPIWMMVARSAFTQLRYSGLLLAGTVLGMALLYLAPPLLLLTGEPRAMALGGIAWLLMSIAYLPTVRYHGLSPLWALTLPLAALLYLAMTVDSARRYWWGRGSRWKGRDYGKPA